MNADNFKYTEYYFLQALKLIVYCYKRIKNEKKVKPYSRSEIHQNIKRIKKSENVHNEIENYLRNDLVNNYLKKLFRQFGLEYFSIQAGAEVSKQNVAIGIVDIQFINFSASSLEGLTYIFECKRLNKYSQYLNGYVNEGMNRFITRKYYAESNVPFAGMIAFVEVDLNKKPNGYKPLNDIVLGLENLIKSNKTLNLLEGFVLYPLHDDNYKEISTFKYSYLSKHKRQGDNFVINIHHLFLDYNDILIS